jgi:catechol 2,3-dioxygenase-like lactoylglutathione lyase family enzyme
MYTVQKIEVILTVPSIEETAAWYKRLGWRAHMDTFNKNGHCLFGSVTRDIAKDVEQGEELSTVINLSRFAGDPVDYNDDHSNFTTFIAVDDVDAVYATAIANGIYTGPAPETQLWGGKTLSIQDLNGFHLTFYQQMETPTLDEVRQRYEQAQTD